MTHIDCVQRFLEQQELRAPIYTVDMAEALSTTCGLGRKQASATASVAVKRIMDEGRMPELRRWERGVYYRTVETPFGETGINLEKVISRKYLSPGKGYETGLRLINRMGLSTQMPRIRMLATNTAKRVRHDERLDVMLCPPKAPVNTGNKFYLQMLDAIDLLDKAPIDIRNPYKLIAMHIKKRNLQYNILLSYAYKYYNHKTIINIARIASCETDSK